jgi:hypothetical protein
MISNEHDLHVTRLDLQITALLAQPRKLVRELMGESFDATDSPNLAFVSKTKALGETCYVGSRKSDLFGRLYDKGCQARLCDEGLIWRWEVEYKRRMASRVWDAMCMVDLSREFVAANVTGFFNHHSIVCPDCADGDYPIVAYATRVESSQRTIDWLSAQVRPAMRRIYDDGRINEALKALGIEGEFDLREHEAPGYALQRDFFALLQREAG